MKSKSIVNDVETGEVVWKLLKMISSLDSLHFLSSALLPNFAEKRSFSHYHWHSHVHFNVILNGKFFQRQNCNCLFSCSFSYLKFLNLHSIILIYYWPLAGFFHCPIRRLSSLQRYFFFITLQFSLLKCFQIWKILLDQLFFIVVALFMWTTAQAQ